MLVVAKSVKGQEFLYSPKSAHQVKGLSAQKMAEFLNKQNHDLKENEVWYVHDVGMYDRAYAYAETQIFERSRSGNVRQKFRMRGC